VISATICFSHGVVFVNNFVSVWEFNSFCFEVRFKIFFLKKHQIDIFLVFFDDFNILISQKKLF